MTETSERRRVVRLSVPRHLSGPLLEIRLARLLDFSSEGARIEHPDPLREGVVCLVDFPPAFGRFRLTARVVWTQLHQSEPAVESAHASYRSGLTFVQITPEQRTALETALYILADQPGAAAAPAWGVAGEKGYFHHHGLGDGQLSVHGAGKGHSPY